MTFCQLILIGLAKIEEEASPFSRDTFQRKWDLLVRLGREHPEEMALLISVAKRMESIEGGPARTVH